MCFLYEIETASLKGNLAQVGHTLKLIKIGCFSKILFIRLVNIR